VKAKIVLGVVLVAAVGAALVQAAETPSVRGSYRLIKRTLPDGSQIVPPAISGLNTFTREYRNFNVAWKQPDGTPVSLSLISSYELTAQRYCEHPLFWLQDNLGKPGIANTWPPEKEQCSDVKQEGGKLTFEAKGEPVVMTFEGDTMTAVAAGMFTDTWQRIR
jgi:hypothetical protein